jgi:ABC-type bacteriocin/lantibiotic exporter with double-glycine peptidase domain
MRRRRGLRVVAQRKNWDCGVAALASLLDEPYGDIAAAVRELFPDRQAIIRRYGLNVSETEKVAAHLGTSLVRRYRNKDYRYLDNGTGILGIFSPKMPTAGHWVVLKDGTHIVDPDGAEIWKLDDYLKHWGARPTTLLARED